MLREKTRKKRWRLCRMGLMGLMLLSLIGCGKKSGTDASGDLSFGRPEIGGPEATDEASFPEETKTAAGGETADGETPAQETAPETVPEETEPPVVFSGVNETVYAADRVNIRLEPSTKAEILKTMYVGEAVLRTGISDQWSRIIYNGGEYYAASEYLSREPVIADTLEGRVEQLLPGMQAAARTDQLVLAVGQNDGGDRCTVFYYTKDENGSWTRRFETEGFWGFNGVKEVILEADGCTPVGCFPFRFAYGINEDPGSVMEYKQATPTAYMVDDVNSRYYNQWVDTADEGVVVDWATAEHVIDFKTSYNYGLYIDNNPDCNPSSGSSVICIHCTSPRGFSPGCINIAQEHILTLVTELDYDSRIVIVYGVEDLVNY